MAMVLNENQRTRLIDELIGNSGCCDEKDRTYLTKMSDRGLLHLQESVLNALVVDAVREAYGAPPELAVNELPDFIKKKMEEGGDEEEEEDEEVENKKPACNQAAPQTLEDWMKLAPVEVQEIVANAYQVQEQERQTLIGKLTANVAKDQKEAVANLLANKSLSELQGLQALVPQQPTAPSFNTNGFFMGSAPVSNAARPKPMPLPDHDLAVAKARGGK